MTSQNVAQKHTSHVKGWWSYLKNGFEGVCSYLKKNCLLFVTENVCAVFSSDGEGDSANICIVLLGILKPDVWMDKKLRFDIRV